MNISGTADEVLFSQHFERDRDWRHVRNIMVELEAYRHAESALLESRFENPELDVAALQEGLRNIAGFHRVPHPPPQLFVGDGDVVAAARRLGLTGEAIIEAHALAREHSILWATGANSEVIATWHRRRIWAENEAKPLNAAARVYDLLGHLLEKWGFVPTPHEQSLLLELSMLAPLDPATWGDEELSLDAVHPALRYLQLLHVFYTQLAPLPSQGLSLADVDDTFAYLGWPTLTEQTSRSMAQEPFDQEIFSLAVKQYVKLDLSPDDSYLMDEPLLMMRETLRESLTLRNQDPTVFSHHRHPFPWPLIIEYYRDETWLRNGFDPDVESRHHRLARSLLAAWLLQGEVVHFQLAAQQYVSMLGYLHAWRTHLSREHGREVELNVHMPSPEEVLKRQFFVEANSPF